MPKKTQRRIKTRLSVSVTQQQKKRLERIATESDVSVSRVVQEAIKQFIKHHTGGSLITSRIASST